MTIYRDLTPPRLDPRQLRPVPCPAGRSRSREVRSCGWSCGAVEIPSSSISEVRLSGDQCLSDHSLVSCHLLSLLSSSQAQHQQFNTIPSLMKTVFKAVEMHNLWI